MPASILLPHEVEDINFAAYSQSINIYGTKPDQYTAMFDQDIGMPLEATSSLTIAQKQKFTIREMSPDWGYAREATKVSFQKFYEVNFFIYFLFIHLIRVNLNGLSINKSPPTPHTH